MQFGEMLMRRVPSSFNDIDIIRGSFTELTNILKESKTSEELYNNTKPNHLLLPMFLKAAVFCASHITKMHAGALIFKKEDDLYTACMDFLLQLDVTILQYKRSIDTMEEFINHGDIRLPSETNRNHFFDYFSGSESENFSANSPQWPDLSDRLFQVELDLLALPIKVASLKPCYTYVGFLINLLKSR